MENGEEKGGGKGWGTNEEWESVVRGGGGGEWRGTGGKCGRRYGRIGGSG